MGRRPTSPRGRERLVAAASAWGEDNCYVPCLDEDVFRDNHRVRRRPWDGLCQSRPGRIRRILTRS